MSLLFSNGSTNHVNFGNDATLNDLTAFTWFTWLYHTASTNGRLIMAKKPGIKIIRHGGSGSYRLSARVNRATTNTEVDTVNNTYSLNVWQFLAFKYDESGGSRATTINILTGDLSTPATEIGYVYTEQGAGSTVVDAADPLVVGNISTSGSAGFPGRIAIVGVIPSYLTDNQIVTLQWTTKNALGYGAVLYSHLGFNGTGTQPDWSGNGNSGTVTGATVADHVPLSPSFGFDEYMSYIIAAGGADIRKQIIQAYMRINI